MQFGGAEATRERRSVSSHSSSHRPGRAAVAAIIALVALSTVPSCANEESITEAGEPDPDADGLAEADDTEPVDVVLFAHGELVRIQGSTRTSLATLPGDGAAAPPIGTPHGTLVHVTRGADRVTGELWLVDVGQQTDLIADNVTGFAIGRRSDEVVYTRTEALGDLRYGQTQLITATLPTGAVEFMSSPRAGYARVVGAVGTTFLVNAGDGASTRVEMWDPAADVVSVVRPGALAVATHTGTRRAIIAGDSGCWTVVDFSSSTHHDVTPASCALYAESARFSPDGAYIVGVSRSHADSQQSEVFLAPANSESSEQAAARLDGSYQVAWQSETTALALADDGRAALIYRCDFSRGQCSRTTAPPLDVAPADGGSFGQIWLQQDAVTEDSA